MAGKALFECSGLIPANAETVKYRTDSRSVAAKAALFFYRMQLPWAEQKVGWVLRFFESSTALQLQNLPARCDCPNEIAHGVAV
jgi:hypothetical protein